MRDGESCDGVQIQAWSATATIFGRCCHLPRDKTLPLCLMWGQRMGLGGWQCNVRLKQEYPPGGEKVDTQLFIGNRNVTARGHWGAVGICVYSVAKLD